MFDFVGNMRAAGQVRAEMRGCDRATKNCGGWWCSDYDTWEECPECFTGQRHPEEEPEPEPGAKCEFCARAPCACPDHSEEEPREVARGPRDDIPF